MVYPSFIQTPFCGKSSELRALLQERLGCLELWLSALREPMSKFCFLEEMIFRPQE
jgi:hypothetical protein